MRTIDHHLLAQPCLAQHGAGRFDVRRVVVGRLAAAQDDVAVAVAARLEDRRHAHLGHAHEGMRSARGKHRISSHLHAAVGAVLEADGAAQAGGKLAVALALGRARADRAPGDEVADVLRREQVEKLAAGGQAERADVEQQLARAPQAFVDAKAAVQARVVDVALPAHRRARLLEVDAHDDDELAAEFVSQRLEPARVGDGRVVVVNRTGPDDGDEAVVAPLQHVADGSTAALDEGLGGRSDGHLFEQDRR